MLRRSPALSTALLVLAACAPSAGALGKAGDLDPTFNGGHEVRVSAAESSPPATAVSDVAVDDVGRIVLAGTALDVTGSYGTMFARRTADGAADASFGGGDGAVVAQQSNRTPPYSQLQELVPAPGGAIAAVIYRLLGASGRPDLAVGRVGSDGAPALAYGTAGVAHVDPYPAQSTPEGGAAAADGTTWVVGNSLPANADDRRLVITRFQPDGSATGGTNLVGVSAVPGGAGPTEGADVALLPDGKLLATGNTRRADGRTQGFLARLSPSTGALDSGYGTSGYRHVDAGAGPAGGQSTTLSSVAVSGSVAYAAGSATDGDGRPAAVVARVLADGSLDPTWGPGGVRRLQLAAGAGVDRASSAQEVVVQPDGKVLVVAIATTSTADRKGVVIRYLADGTLDPDFGSGGVATLPIAPPAGSAGDTRATSGALSAGKLLVAGTTNTATGGEGFVARVLLAPLPDTPAPTGGGETPTVPAGTSPAGTSTPTPAGTTRPAHGGASVATRRLRLDERGRVAVSVRCTGPAACAGGIGLIATSGTVPARAARRAARFGRAPYRVAAGKRKTVRIRLSRSVRRTVARKGHVRARLVVRRTGAARSVVRVTLLEAG